MTDMIKTYIDLMVSRRDKSQPFYLLVDPAVSVEDYYPISMARLPEMVGRDQVTTISRPDRLNEPSRSPHLVQLAAAGDDELTPLAQQVLDGSIYYARNERPSYQRYVCGWLQSPLELADLAQNISNRMMQKQKGELAVVPIHEPLVQELLAYACHQVEPHLHSSWLSPISQWFIPSSHQGITFLPGSTQAINAPLPASTLDIMFDRYIIADILALWHRHGRTTDPVLRQQMPLITSFGEFPLPDDAAYKAHQALEQGRKLGITNYQDLITFTIMRLIAHPYFDTHSRVNALLQESIKNKGGYGERLTSIKYPQWMQVLAELQTQYTPQY